MEFRSVIWTTLTMLWSVHSLKIELLGGFTGLILAHDDRHPMGANVRHVREVKNSTHQSRDMVFPFTYCCGGDNNTVDEARNASFRLIDGCINELNQEDEWTKYGNPAKDPFTIDTIKKLEDYFNCFNDCMMRRRGMLREDGTEDIEKWEELTIKQMSFPWLKDLALVAFHKCVDIEDYHWLKNGEKLKCSPRALDINHCVWREIIMTCPEEHYIENDYCKRVKLAFEEVDG